MPFNLTDAMHWYHRIFKPLTEDNLLMYNNPEDWTRLQVWDGTTLKPAMPPDFSGIPSEEQINTLYSHVQNQTLFLFELGNPEPFLVGREHRYQISLEPKEPVPPPPLVSENPTAEERNRQGSKQNAYDASLMRYRLSQDIHAKCGPGFKAAADSYNAQRDQEQDTKERKSRDLNANARYIRYKMNRSRADQVITDVMSPRPSAPPEIFYVHDAFSRGTAFHYSYFDNDLEPNGYDLPNNSKLTNYDAATINFMMLGVHSHNAKFLAEKGDRGPLWALGDATNGFHMLVTGLFGKNRINVALEDCLGEAMKLGKEAVYAYLNNNDPRLLGQRLSEGVLLIKQQFTGTGQYSISEGFVAASKLTERLLHVFDTNPEIWKATGLDDKELDFMRGYVQIGQLYDRVLDGMIKVNDAAAKGTDLTPEEKAQILTDAVILKLVEADLRSDCEIAESSSEYTNNLTQAIEKDAVINQKITQWERENEPKYVKDKTDKEGKQKYLAELAKFQKLNDWNIHSLLAGTQNVEHPIIHTLAQPGMIERLRQELMQNPAILEQANKSPFGFTADNLEKGSKVEALATQLQPAAERIQKNAWFDRIKSMLTKDNPNAWMDPAVASDSNRLMIVQKNENGDMQMVSVASLLADGLQSLQNPNKNTIDQLFEYAKNGNLYFYGKDNDMPTRLSTDGMKPSAQQLKAVPLPTRWQRFWHTVTLGWAYAKECNLPDKDPKAFELIIKSRQAHAVSAPNEAEVPRQQEQPEQPKPEQPKPVEIKPWKYQAKDTRNMSNDQFFEHVEAAYKRGSDLDIISVMTGNNFTPESYYEVLTQLLEAQVARDIYIKASSGNDEERKNTLEANKQNYTAIVVGLGDYVVSHTDKTALAQHCLQPEDYTDAFETLRDSAEEIRNTGVFGYYTQLKREIAENEKVNPEAHQKNLPKNEVSAENNPPKNQQEMNPVINI